MRPGQHLSTRQQHPNIQGTSRKAGFHGGNAATQAFQRNAVDFDEIKIRIGTDPRRQRIKALAYDVGVTSSLANAA